MLRSSFFAALGVALALWVGTASASETVTLSAPSYRSGTTGQIPVTVTINPTPTGGQLDVVLIRCGGWAGHCFNVAEVHVTNPPASETVTMTVPLMLKAVTYTLQATYQDSSGTTVTSIPYSVLPERPCDYYHTC